MEQKRKIIFYLDTIYQLGGIETWLYNLTSIIKDHFNVLVLWRVADPVQLARLEVPHQKYDPQSSYRCDILLNMIDGRPYAVHARRTIQMVHANYDILPNYRYRHWERTDGYVFVSEAALRHFPHSLSSYDATVLTNPVYVPPNIVKHEPENPNALNLVVATRFTSEKGGIRYVQLARQLYMAKIPAKIHVWTNWDFDRFNSAFQVNALKSYFVFHPTKLGLYQEMADADYVVQLSDCESFCYTVHESLAVKTPVLVTNWDGVDDYVRNGENGYIYTMKMNGVDPHQLLNRPNSFFKAKNENSENWIDYLEKLKLPTASASSYGAYFLK